MQEIRSDVAFKISGKESILLCSRFAAKPCLASSLAAMQKLLPRTLLLQWLRVEGVNVRAREKLKYIVSTGTAMFCNLGFALFSQYI